MFLASVLKSAAVLVLIAAFSAVEAPWQGLLGQLLLEAMLAAALSPPVFAILAHTRSMAVEEAE